MRVCVYVCTWASGDRGKSVGSIAGRRHECHRDSLLLRGVSPAQFFSIKFSPPLFQLHPLIPLITSDYPTDGVLYGGHPTFGVVFQRADARADLRVVENAGYDATIRCH